MEYHRIEFAGSVYRENIHRGLSELASEAVFERVDRKGCSPRFVCMINCGPLVAIRSDGPFMDVIIIIIIKNLRISEGISPNMTQSRVQRWGFEVDKSYKDK